MKTKCHDKMPVRLGPEWDFSLWFALQGSLASTQFVFSRIRDQFANIQSSCATETALPQFSSFSRFSRSASAPVHSAQGVERPSRLKRGIGRCHLSLTTRYRGRVLEFRWHTTSWGLHL
jgi:hypothetical protein